MRLRSSLFWDNRLASEHSSPRLCNMYRGRKNCSTSEKLVHVTNSVNISKKRRISHIKAKFLQERYDYGGHIVRLAMRTTKVKNTGCY